MDKLDNVKHDLRVVNEINTMIYLLGINPEWNNLRYASKIEEHIEFSLLFSTYLLHNPIVD